MSATPEDRPVSRRQVLGETVAAGLATLLDQGPTPRVVAASPAQRDLVRIENRKPGTTDWLLKNVWIDPQTRYRSPRIEGYCSRTSLRAGETLRIMVSTNPASPFTVDLFRLGYYGGKGGRHLHRFGPLAGKGQADPEIGVER